VKKQEVLKNIRTARRSHIMWVERAKALVNGLDVTPTEDKIPLEVTQCEFGQWFYGEGQILLSLFTEEAIQRVTDKHKELHNAYLKIFKLYFFTPKRSFLNKVFNKKPALSERDSERIHIYLDDLEKISEELISYLNIIERKLNSLSEERFQNFL